MTDPATCENFAKVSPNWNDITIPVTTPLFVVLLIGVILYIDPAQKRGGSLSFWAGEEDLRRFVALPRHTAIMRSYRERVSVRAAMWQTDAFHVQDAWAQRHERLVAATGADSD